MFIIDALNVCVSNAGLYANDINEAISVYDINEGIDEHDLLEVRGSSSSS